MRQSRKYCGSSFLKVNVRSQCCEMAADKLQPRPMLFIRILRKPERNVLNQAGGTNNDRFSLRGPLRSLSSKRQSLTRTFREVSRALERPQSNRQPTKNTPSTTDVLLRVQLRSGKDVFASLLRFECYPRHGRESWSRFKINKNKESGCNLN